MQIKSIVAGAAIAMTAMVSPAVADGETGLKEVQGFSVLSSVSADRLSDREMSQAQGAGVLFVRSNPGTEFLISLPDMVTLRMCGNTGCIIDRGKPITDAGGL